MNDYAEALKKQILRSMDITSEETTVFIDVAQRTAAISGINLSEFFEILAGFCRDIDSFFKVIQETAESLTEIFKQVKSLTIPPPLSRLQRLWWAQRRRAEGEEMQVRMKYLAFLYHMKRYKPP